MKKSGERQWRRWKIFDSLLNAFVLTDSSSLTSCFFLFILENRTSGLRCRREIFHSLSLSRFFHWFFFCIIFSLFLLWKSCNDDEKWMVVSNLSIRFPSLLLVSFFLLQKIVVTMKSGLQCQGKFFFPFSSHFFHWFFFCSIFSLFLLW